MNMPTQTNSHSIWCPHVTVATVVEQEGRFLLVEEYVRGRFVLNQPAGHLEPYESLQDAAIRETLEETAWEVKLEAFLSVHQWVNEETKNHFVRFTFAAQCLQHHPERKLDADIIKTLWLSREEIANESNRLRSPMVLASIDEWIAGRRLPLDSIQTLIS